ncbi:MAG TPA: DUF1579 family protein [Patescibacteria group bacterium]|nr:DUF1579 family protein [Patescibacteria group bacterium]
MTSEASTQMPRSAVAGSEMEALAPFYRNWTWTGTIQAGGMGPGSPAMSGDGQAVCRLIQDGLWYDCDFEQVQLLSDGTFVLRWQLHWVAGWDRLAGEYRASSADNNGPSLAIYRGRIDGERLVYESISDALPRIRLTWILMDPHHATWRNEFTLDGETWSLIEEYQMVVA